MTYEDIFDWFVSQGLSNEVADALARQLSQQDYSTWSDDQVFGFFNQWVTEAEAIPPDEPTPFRRLQEIAAQHPLLSLFAIEEPQRTAKLVAQPPTPTLPVDGSPASVDATDLATWFRRQGITPDRAAQTAEQIATTDMTTWSPEQVSRFIHDWAQTTLANERGKAFSAFQGQYDPAIDPRTGLASRGPLVAEQQERFRTMAGQQAIASEQNARARELAEAEATHREAQPAMPTFSQATGSALQGLRTSISPNAQRFFESELPRLFAQGGFAEKRREWWEEKTKFPGREPAGAGEIFLTGTQEEIAEAEAPNIEFRQEKERRAALEDPWQTFLKTFDFEREFRSRTARERGELTSQFRPRTRFL